MNIRSFRRKLDRLEREGWTRKNEYVHKHRGDLEQQLRHAFEECLKNALDEMRGQIERGAGRPFISWGIVQGENGQTFRVTIESEPPSIPGDPSLN